MTEVEQLREQLATARTAIANAPHDTYCALIERDGVRECNCWKANTLAQIEAPSTHSDNIAVDHFASAMKGKLAAKREEGRGGWEKKDECSQAFLSELLVNHVVKGDPVDVGNFCMMLYCRGERIEPSTPSDTERLNTATDLLDELNKLCKHRGFLLTIRHQRRIDNFLAAMQAEKQESGTEKC